MKVEYYAYPLGGGKVSVHRVRSDGVGGERWDAEAKKWVSSPGTADAVSGYSSSSVHYKEMTKKQAADLGADVSA